MRLDTLETVSLPRLVGVVNQAFSDYAIPFQFTEAKLGEMMRRRGVRLDLSVGVLDADELVGFTLNGLGTWQGRVAGYDSGTGVVPEARRRGYSRAMIERTRDVMRGAGAEIYLLEVLMSNDPAIALYESAGFRRTRALVAWGIETVANGEVPSGVDLEIGDRIDPDRMRAMWDWEPSWQHSFEAIGRAGDARVVIEARRGDELAGYAIVFPASSDLAQIAVERGHRRRGIGRALAAEAWRRSANTLRAINVDAGDAGSLAFFGRIGAIEIVRQHEMALDLG